MQVPLHGEGGIAATAAAPPVPHTPPEVSNAGARRSIASAAQDSARGADMPTEAQLAELVGEPVGDTQPSGELAHDTGI